MAHKMTATEANIAISLNTRRLDAITWDHLMMPTADAIVGQPLWELSCLPLLPNSDPQFPEQFTARPMRVLDVAIGEDDYRNIPASILIGHGEEIKRAVEQAIEWDMGRTFSAAWIAEAEAWAGSF
jgi:hypothetical protein